MQVVHFQPHTMFINRVGYSICMRQCDTQSLKWLHPTEPPKHFGWQSGKTEMLMVFVLALYLITSLKHAWLTLSFLLIKLRMDGYQWSAPFAIGSEGLMSICLRSELGSDEINVSIEVRGGTKTSRYEAIFRPASYSSPYRWLLNHTFLYITLCSFEVNQSSSLEFMQLILWVCNNTISLFSNNTKF